jgi:hypothetical protein
MQSTEESRIREMIEEYLLQINLPYEKIDDKMWIIHDEIDNINNIVVLYDDPVVTFRVKVMDVPEKNKEKFFRFLLELNANLLHGAYSLSDNSVILIDNLEAENLDYNEFQATLDSIILALTEDLKKIAEIIK